MSTKGASLLYLVITLALLLPGTGTLPLMDRDEPRFAQATSEMIEGKQWTVPYFNGDYRLDKPPLTYWWMRVHYWVLGKTELAARLHSVFAAWLTAVVIFRLGSFLYSEKSGLLAGLGWLTCLQVLIHGRLAVADMPMILAVTATMDASARLILSGDVRKYGGNFWYLTLALAVGFLAKGPVAWAVPLLAMLLTRWPIGRIPLNWRRLQPLSAFGIATALVAIWGLPAMWQTDWAFFNVGIGEHVVKRGVDTFNGRVNVPVVYYLATALLSLLPWSGFFATAFRFKPWTDQKGAFLTAWFAAPFLIFAFYATQLPHYILPGFPAFFLLLFQKGKLPRLERTSERIAFWGITGLFSALSLGGAIFIASHPLAEPMKEMEGIVWLALLIVATMSVALPVWLWWQGRQANIAWPVIAMWVVLMGLLTHLITAELRTVHPVVEMKEKHFTEFGPKTKFVAEGFEEPSLVYYQDAWGGWKFSGGLDRVHFWLAKPDPERVGVFRARVWRIADAFFAEDGATQPVSDHTKEILEGIDLEKFRIEQVTGYNVARTTWEEMLIAIPIK